MYAFSSGSIFFFMRMQQEWVTSSKLGGKGHNRVKTVNPKIAKTILHRVIMANTPDALKSLQFHPGC